MIAIERLAQSIRHPDIIKGIKVQANQEVKLTQYADDTTALLTDVQSVSNLFDLLTTFESCKPLSCNILYQKLLARQQLPRPTAEERFGYYNFQRDDFSKIYLLPFKATKETKLIMFQYKIIHPILFTNSLLYKLKKLSSPHCPFCPATHQTVTHMFVECVQASIFWSEFQNWILQLCNLQLVLSPQDVIYGIIRQLNPPCLALNHLIILGKYFLYVNALNNEKSSVIDFEILVQDKIQLEKYIAVTSGQQKLFFAKWQNFAHFC